MFRYQRLTAAVTVFGITKAAHHLVKITILAFLGLAGLWMLHTLAQDFQKIFQQIQKGSGPGKAILTTLSNNPFYRSIGKTAAESVGTGNPLLQAFSSGGNLRRIEDKPIDIGNENEGFTGYYQRGYVVKRSISTGNNKTALIEMPEVDWEKVFSRDPARCARSLICQLAARPVKQLETDEESILKVVRLSLRKDNWASEELIRALNYGESTRSITKCKQYYFLCPYAGETMMKILRYFGGT